VAEQLALEEGELAVFFVIIALRGKFHSESF
jgi:hypothetical protein